MYELIVNTAQLVPIAHSNMVAAFTCHGCTCRIVESRYEQAGVVA
jgi:hypothetical protein